MRFTFAATFAALAAVGSVAAQTVPYATEPAAVDVEILQYALTLEHLEAKFYSEALGKFSDADFEAAGYGAQVRQRIGEIAVHEATHVTTLASVITAAGATPTAPCVYDFPYTDIPSFLALSAILEDVGVSAYLYKAQFINEKAYLTAAASILAVEARHQATVSTFQATDPIPSPFDTPLTGSEVLTLATPFFVSCPASNPALPFKTFPSLVASAAAVNVGDVITFTNADGSPVTGKDAYVSFIYGLGTFAVKLDNKGQAAVPEGLYGKVYAVAAHGDARPNDDTTIAGPAILQVGDLADATYSTKARRAIQFKA